MASPVIAVVEDDELLRLGAVSLLRAEDFVARGFASAEAFLNAGPEEFDCLVTDLQMEGMGGLELMAKLRRDGRRIPVIVMTAHKQAALEDAAFSAGARCFLTKPFSSEALLRCIRDALASPV